MGNWWVLPSAYTHLTRWIALRLSRLCTLGPAILWADALCFAPVYHEKIWYEQNMRNTETVNNILNIDENKVLFDYITNMRDYCGPESDIIGGDRYVDEKGFGHELFNFQNEAGKCYGYMAPKSKVN